MNNMHVAEVLMIFNSSQHVRQSLARNDTDGGYSQTIDSITAATITQINKTYPHAAVLLGLMAYLAAAPVTDWGADDGARARACR